MINTLLRIIDDENINFIEHDLTSISIKGLYFDNTIIVEKNIETVAERSCIIAEELGHHMTNVENILDLTTLRNQKEEEKARRWASKVMFNPSRLIDAFKAGISNRWELSQFLDLTEEFIEESLTYFKKFYGERITIGEYTIHFDPLWIYKSFEQGGNYGSAVEKNF